MTDISTFLGFFEEEGEVEEVQLPQAKPATRLTPEEEFFLEQLKDLNVRRVLPKFTPDGIAFGELAPMLTYYNQEQINALLESLSRKGYIKKMNYGTVALCPSCCSPVIMILLSCPKCGSLKLGKNEAIKHKECGYTGSIQDFFDGSEFRCPRCGARYDPEDHSDDDVVGFTIGESLYECERCGTATKKPSVTYNCIKCKTKFSGGDILFENPNGFEVVDALPDAVEKPVERAPPPPSPRAASPRLEDADGYKPPPREEEALAQEPEEVEPDAYGVEEQEPQLDEPEYLDHEPPRIEEQPPALEDPDAFEDPDSFEDQHTEPEEYVSESVKEESEPAQEDYEWEPTEEEPEPPEEVELIVEEEPQLKPVPEPAPIIPEPEPMEEPKAKSPGLLGKLFSKKEKPKPRPVEKAPLRVEREVVRRKETSILLIEADEERAEKIVSSLERTRLPCVEVRHAFTGKLGLRELRRNYDVIILDVELGDTDPKLILTEIVRWKINTPVVVICDDEEKRRFYRGVKLEKVEFLDSSDRSIKQLAKIVNGFLS